MGNGNRRPTDMPVLLAVVQEARSLFGVKAARSLWHVVGLPASAEMIERENGVATDHPISPSPEQTALAAFLDEGCEPNRGGRVQAAVLHQAYVAWAQLTDAPALSLTAFGRLMRRLGRAKTYASRVYYLGLSVREVARSPESTPSPCPLFDVHREEQHGGVPMASEDGQRA